MRWRKDGKKASPSIGTERIQSGWCIIPLTLEGETRWLEHAIWYQQWQAIAPGGQYHGVRYGWVDTKWSNY